jgi:hypothetical protein
VELLLDTLWMDWAEACALGREDEREYDDIVLSTPRFARCAAVLVCGAIESDGSAGGVP